MGQKNNNRQELDINFLNTIIAALVLTILIYVLALPFQETYVGMLLLKRGFTQFLTVFCAFLVITITVDKYLKISKENKVFKKLGIPEEFSFENHQSVQLLHLQEDLSRTSTMITNRLRRVINAYINSGSRKTVTDFALDDSSFYLSASESSYAVPRILVWAIPLLGFIGTVLGISSAVNGFTGFLENTAEIDQIKEGIGTVTSGLAVAFDTTLLALLLSVVVMIPLVLIERMESNLLLATDIYINDYILPRLNEKQTGEKNDLNTEVIVNTINTTLEKQLPTKEELIKPIKEALPTPEELISPAQIYAQEAAKNLVTEFVNQFQKIYEQEQQLLNTIKEVNAVILEDRNKFIQTFGQQNDLNQSIITNIKELVDLVQKNNETNSQGLVEASQAISQQLNKAAVSLEEKVTSLEASSARIAELKSLQSNLEKIVEVLHNVGDMEKTLVNIQDKITNIQPTLQDLSKPRVIRLVEQIDN